MGHLSFSAIGLLGVVAIQALVQAPSGQVSPTGDAPPQTNLAPALSVAVTAKDANLRDDLLSARASVIAGHVDRAKQSLEIAEIHVIWCSLPPAPVSVPDNRQMVADIRDIRQALGDDDGARTIQLIDLALAHSQATPLSRPDECDARVDRAAPDPFRASILPRLAPSMWSVL
jgi:hypothetical protein